MALSPEYTDLKARCQMCASHGYQIGKAAQYVADLQLQVGEPDLPQETAVNSPQHLLILLEMAEKGEMVVKAPKVAPRTTPKAPEPVVEVEEAAVEPLPDTTPEPDQRPAKKNRR